MAPSTLLARDFFNGADQRVRMEIDGEVFHGEYFIPAAAVGEPPRSPWYSLSSADSITYLYVMLYGERDQLHGSASESGSAMR
jgi:hypothetical protein